jgi:hypothetical protein
VNRVVVATIVAGVIVIGGYFAWRAWRIRDYEAKLKEVAVSCSDDGVAFVNHGDAKTLTLLDAWLNDHGSKPARKIERLGGRKEIALPANGTATVPFAVATDVRCARPACWPAVAYRWSAGDAAPVSYAGECAPAPAASGSPAPPATPTP